MKKNSAIINHLKQLITRYENNEIEMIHLEYKIETHPISVDGNVIEHIDTGIRTEKIVWREK